MTRDGIGEPKASQLDTGHSLSSVTECFNVCSAYPTMAPGRHKGKVATVAEIHDVLTRRIEDFGGLPRRKEILSSVLDHGFNFVDSHGRKDSSINPTNTTPILWGGVSCLCGGEWRGGKVGIGRVRSRGGTRQQPKFVAPAVPFNGPVPSRRIRRRTIVPPKNLTRNRMIAYRMRNRMAARSETRSADGREGGAP